MARVLIVGHGIVGSYLSTVFKDADVVDPGKPEVEHFTAGAHYDTALICVPTPRSEDGSCDTSMVTDAVKDVSARFQIDVICIKSTVPPGFTQQLGRELGLRLVFSPEYCGETIHSQAIDERFTIVGGDPADTAVVARAFQSVKRGDHRIWQADAATAELAKYMENTYLAMMVTFANEFYRIGLAYGVEYTRLRELFICDPRVNPSHTIVYPEHPYYESKCFDKDLPGIVAASRLAGYEPRFVEQVIENNERHKRTFRDDSANAGPAADEVCTQDVISAP